MAYYVTKKRVAEYINSKKVVFNTIYEFKVELSKVIKDLYDDGFGGASNKNQIRFFGKVLLSVN